MQQPPAAFLMFGVIGLMACSEKTRPEPATADRPGASAQGTSDGMSPASGSRAAADQIAEARCHREMTCGKIGTGRDYSSLTDCQEFVRTSWKVDLDPLMCAGGINQSHLEECLTEIRGASCDSPMDQLERVAACTQGQICIEKR